MSRPRGTSPFTETNSMCQNPIGPLVCSVNTSAQSTHLPSDCRLHVICTPYGCALCHHCSGDMCHSRIGPPVPTTSATRPTAMCHLHMLPRQCQLCMPCQLYDHMTYTFNFHVALYGLYNHHYFFPVWPNE